MADKGLNKIGLIVMGPCACGKSEVGKALAKLYSCPFLDGDGFHPEENILKMQNGIPLTDEDRIPWLERVRYEMIANCKMTSTSETKGPAVGDHEVDDTPINVGIVAACSSLKTSYRDILHGGGQPSNEIGCRVSLEVVFVFLNCSREVLEERLTKRKGHFMKLGMLDSQLKTLQPMDDKEASYFITVNGDLELEDLILEANEKLKTLIAG